MVETASKTISIYLDEVVGAVEGTVISRPQEIKVILGDMNMDGVLNTLDLALVRTYYKNGFPNGKLEYAADWNTDGEITEQDLAALQQYLLGVKTSV